MPRPFGTPDLFARIRAALRHRLQQKGEPPLFRSGDLEVDLVRRLVRVRGEEVKLTPKEYDILRMLVERGWLLVNPLAAVPYPPLAPNAGWV